MFWLLAFFVGLHTLTIAVLLWRLFLSRNRSSEEIPATAILCPLCGIEEYTWHCANNIAALSVIHPKVQVLFCVSDSADPVIGLVKDVANTFPRAKVLVGRNSFVNPKLDNLLKGYRTSRSPYVVIIDSNVSATKEHLPLLFGRLKKNVGLVCSPPVGVAPSSFWGEMECVVLNGYQIKWQYLADWFGMGFCMGKTVLFKRDILEQCGGLESLSIDINDDAAFTKVVRDLGLRVTLIDVPVKQPIGRRTFRQFWSRQVRWARLRRSSFLWAYLPEIAAGSIGPLVLAALISPWLALGVAGFWWGTEMLLCWALGWKPTWRYPLLALLRELLLVGIWLGGFGNAFTWRGTKLKTRVGN